MHWKEEIQLCWRKPETIDCVLHWFLAGHLLKRRPKDWKRVRFWFVHLLFIYLSIYSFSHILKCLPHAEHWAKYWSMNFREMTLDKNAENDSRRAFALVYLVQDSLFCCRHEKSLVNFEYGNDKVRF